MKNLKLRSFFFSKALTIFFCAQIFLFSQCEKEQEVEPSPEAAESPEYTELPVDSVGTPDPETGTEEPVDPGTPDNSEEPETTPSEGGSKPQTPAPTPTNPTPADPKDPATKPAPENPKPSDPKTPEPKPTDPKTPDQKPADPITPEQKPADPKAPEQKPADPKAPEQKPTDPKTPEPKPSDPKAPEPKPTTPTNPAPKPVPNPTKPTKPTVPTTPVPGTPTNPAPVPQLPSSVAYTIRANEPIVDFSKIKVAPGSVIKIQGGTRGALLLKNLEGTASQPITIVNDGAVIIRSGGSYGLKTENCKFFRLTGSSGNGYGITVDGGHIGISFDKLSTEIQMDRVEVKNCGFAGVMAKTDPSCDQSSWRQNFVMSNLNFHHNYIHDVKGEGFYVGNSFYASGRSLSCGNILPHSITNAHIYNNRIENTGCEGIQAGCVISGLKIYNNTVENFGISPFAAAQNNGVQIGEGSSGLMYNNIIKKGPGNGIIVLGMGNTKIYNNLVIDAGTYGAFIDNRGPASGDIAFVNNTFINPKEGGFKTYNELVANKFYNNIIAGTTNYFSYGSNATGHESNNLLKATVAECKFAHGGYKLTAASEAVNKGMNPSAYGVHFDLDNKPRSASACDIGAYEL